MSYRTAVELGVITMDDDRSTILRAHEANEDAGETVGGRLGGLLWPHRWRIVLVRQYRRSLELGLGGQDSSNRRRQRGKGSRPLIFDVRCTRGLQDRQRVTFPATPFQSVHRTVGVQAPKGVASCEW
jgi:hypothetical protein